MQEKVTGGKKKSFTLFQDSLADLRKYPAPIQELIADEQTQIVIGDLHGNTFKLLYLLIKAGIISLSKQDYVRFGNIYYKATEGITQEDIQTVREVFDRIRFLVPNKLVFRAVGDTIHDRGSNDLWSWFLYPYLTANLDFRINHSNHDAEFLKIFQVAEEEEFVSNNHQHFQQWGHFARSTANLMRLINKNLVDIEELKDVVIHHYYPSLKIVDYSRIIDPDTDKPGLMIYTHAIADLSTIKQLIAVDLPSCFDELPHKFPKSVFSYKDETIDDLVNTIKTINMLADFLIKEGHYDKLYQLGSYDFIINNRDLNKVNRDQEFLGLNFMVIFCHGHDMQSYPNVIVLDDYFGKKADPRPYPGQMSQIFHLAAEPSPVKPASKPLNSKSLLTMEDVFNIEEEESERSDISLLGLDEESEDELDAIFNERKEPVQPSQPRVRMLKKNERQLLDKENIKPVEPAGKGSAKDKKPSAEPDAIKKRCVKRNKSTAPKKIKALNNTKKAVPHSRTEVNQASTEKKKAAALEKVGIYAASSTKKNEAVKKQANKPGLN